MRWFDSHHLILYCRDLSDHDHAAEFMLTVKYRGDGGIFIVPSDITSLAGILSMLC